jgi:predicted metalloendopeptidase
MLAQVVFQYSGILSEELRQPYLGFYRAVYGIEARSPLWVRCVRSTSFHLNAAVTALYVKKKLPDTDLKKVNN